MSICPPNESIAAKDAIRSLKLGPRRNYTQRSVTIQPTQVIAFPRPLFLLPVAANN